MAGKLSNNPSQRTVLTRQKKFLVALQTTGKVSDASDAAAIDRHTAYRWRDRYPEFKAKWDAIVEADTDELERVARERAMKSSDMLMMFLLNARRPDVYVNRRKVEISAGDGPLININLGEKQREALSDALRQLPAEPQDD